MKVLAVPKSGPKSQDPREEFIAKGIPENLTLAGLKQG
jgi:hypothetical protein